MFVSEYSGITHRTNESPEKEKAEYICATSTSIDATISDFEVFNILAILVFHLVAASLGKEEDTVNFVIWRKVVRRSFVDQLFLVLVHL